MGVRPLVLSALGSDVLDLLPTGEGSIVARAAGIYRARRTRAAVAAADVVFTDSVSLAKTVRERVPGTKTEIVRFGVEVTPPPPSARAAWRKRLGIDDNAFVLLSSRLVRPIYNLDTIVRALPRVRERLPNTVLVLKELPEFSHPDYRRRCLGLADELGVRDAMREIGELERDELLELHAAADVFLSVPDTDGTAVSVFEAMAAGVAVVASDVPGIDPEILRRDETALLVPRRDPAALAAAVVALGTDRERRRGLVEAAKSIVDRYGNFDRELDRAVALYAELLERYRDPP
jgi:glycosyltransferase involved in cell wall biosynthesis